MAQQASQTLYAQFLLPMNSDDAAALAAQVAAMTDFVVRVEALTVVNVALNIRQMLIISTKDRASVQQEINDAGITGVYISDVPYITPGS